MIRKTVKDELLEQFDRLTPELQQRVVDFAKQTASQPLRGVKGTNLLPFVLAVDGDDLQQMRAAIDTACEQVDSHGW